MATEADSWGVDLGSGIAGIPVRMQYSCIVLVVVEVICVMLQYHEPRFTVLMFLLYGPVLMGTILIHELGHALTTKRLGGKVEGIILSPLGGFALCGPTDGHVVEDLWVAVAGPIAHLPQMIFWVSFFAIMNKGDFTHFESDINVNYLKQGGWIAFWSIICVQATLMNLALFVFNLAIPAYPMDGGRCLAALLVMGGASSRTAGIITSIAALGSGALFILIGIVPMASLSGVFLALFGGFILTSGVELLKMSLRGNVHEHPLFDRECYRSSKEEEQWETDDEEEEDSDMEDLVSIV